VLSISYLFLGGAGAGALFLNTVLDLRSPWASQDYQSQLLSRMSELSFLRMHESQQEKQTHKTRSRGYKPQPVYRGLFSAGYVAGLVVLALGILCLLADLGRIDRVLFLFTLPTISLIAIGTYALTILLLVAIALSAVWLFGLNTPWRWLITTLRVIILIFSVSAMLYTGLLFQSMGTGLLIGSFLLPILFLLSSLSTGGAILLIVFTLARKTQGFKNICDQLIRVDCIVIALELLTTGALVVQALLTPGFAQTVEALTQGSESIVFWVGFIVCGLAVPFVFELIQWKKRSDSSQRSGARPSFVLVAALVLVGGFSLRWCVVMAGLPVFVASMIQIGG